MFVYKFKYTYVNTASDCSLRSNEDNILKVDHITELDLAVYVCRYIGTSTLEVFYRSIFNDFKLHFYIEYYGIRKT